MRKGRLKAVNINEIAGSIPESVTVLKPLLYVEGHSYIAWYEGDGKVLYGLGKTALEAVQDFDRRYRTLQTKKATAAEPAPQAVHGPFIQPAIRRLEQWLSNLKGTNRYHLPRLLKKE